MFNREAVLEISKEYDSFYLYDQSKIIEYASQLKSAFKNVKFLYSNKTNPNPMVVETVISQGFGSDAASINEVIMGNSFGLPKEEIFYSAPGKSSKDLYKAMDISIIIADSINEIIRIQETAQEKGIIAEVGIRINPDFSFYSDEGAASKFGIDEKIVFENERLLKDLKNVRIIGIHVHLRSQELEADVLKKYYENILALSNKIQEKLAITLKFINLGSGLGINYALSDQPLDIISLGKATSEMILKFKEKMPEVIMYIETGRFVVTKCGVYVTKVLDRKKSYGKNYIVLNNTLNGFIRPSLAQLISSYSPDKNPRGSEPLFTSSNAFDFIALTKETEEEEVTLVGNLCTSTDVVAKDILMPKLKCGDIVVITNAGSYAAVLSPMQFSSQTPPAQLYLYTDGSVINTMQ